MPNKKKKAEVKKVVQVATPVVSEPAPEVKPGDPVRIRGNRPGFITAQPYEPKTGGFTLLRYRHARAVAAVNSGKVKRAEIVLPVEATTEIVERLERFRKWSKLAIESIEDFDAIMSNPEWLVADKAKKVEMIMGTMHSRLTNLKTLIE